MYLIILNGVFLDHYIRLLTALTEEQIYKLYNSHYAYIYQNMVISKNYTKRSKKMFNSWESRNFFFPEIDF